MRRVLLVLAAVAVAAGALVPAPGAEARRRLRPIRAMRLAGGLDYPAAFTVAPDGRIFYGERFTGEIRVLDPGTDADTLFFAVPDVASVGEQGLLGLALHPDFPGTPAVYAYATRVVDGAPRNQILAIAAPAGPAEVIFETTAGEIHNGGRILFGHDGMLYAVVGENGDPSRAQDLSSTAGKVLRMKPDGTVPADNPFKDSLVWSYGHRNSFGLAVDPFTGWIWVSENGPTCNDEVNVVKTPGRNYGWGPSATCTRPVEPADTNLDGPDPVAPAYTFERVVAPTGAVFCYGHCGLGSFPALHMLLGTYNRRSILRVEVGSEAASVLSVSVLFRHRRPVLSLERSPDGPVFFSDPDGIYRLVEARQ